MIGPTGPTIRPWAESMKPGAFSVEEAKGHQRWRRLWEAIAIACGRHLKAAEELPQSKSASCGSLRERAADLYCGVP